MKNEMILATLFAMLTSLPAASVTLAWDPSSGTGVVGYKIYYGPASGTYTNFLATGNITNATIDNLVAGGSYYFAATAVTAGGVESAFSNEIQYQVAQNTPTDYIVTLSNLDQVYDGMTKPVTVAPVPPGASVVVTYNGASQPSTTAGDYLVVASVVSTNGLFSATNMLIVGQAPAAVSLGMLAQVYDGSPKQVMASTQPANLPLAITYNGSAAAPKSTGSYTVIAAVNDGNHVGGATNTLVISKAQASVIVTNAVQGFIYDGKSKQFSFTTSPAGLPTMVIYAGKGTNPIFIGNYPVVITISDTNYTGTGSGQMLILRRQTTISLGGLSQTFNGTPRQVTVTTLPAGVPVAVTYNGSLTPPSAVGKYTVVASVTDSNYSGTITGVMAITAAPGPNSLAKTPSAPSDSGAENLLMLSWDSVSSPVTLFHSSDLISWEKFGTTDGSTNAMVLPIKPGAHFFRATVENADGIQGVPLKLRPQTSMP